MRKADILDVFAVLNLIIFGIAAALFIVQGANAIYGGTASMLIGLGLIFAGLFQYAILGGAAEVIKRLVSIDENIKERPSAPVIKTPVTSRGTGEIGRAGR